MSEPTTPTRRRRGNVADTTEKPVIKNKPKSKPIDTELMKADRMAAIEARRQQELSQQQALMPNEVVYNKPTEPDEAPLPVDELVSRAASIVRNNEIPSAPKPSSAIPKPPITPPQAFLNSDPKLVDQALIDTVVSLSNVSYAEVEGRIEVLRNLIELWDKTTKAERREIAVIIAANIYRNW